MHQRSFASGSRQAPDPYDQYLEQHGFYRKHTARDSSSLFRVVSEQMFDTQLEHSSVRQSCVDFMRKNPVMFQSLVDRDYDEYLDDLSKPKAFGSLIELQALGLLYRRNIILFEPFNLGNPYGHTNESFADVFRVFCSPDNHFDSVFTSDYIEDAALCQSLCYEILYKDLFKLPDVFFAVDQMLHDLNGHDQQKASMYCAETKDGYCTRMQLSDGRSFELDLPSETNCILENSNQCAFHADKKDADKDKDEQGFKRAQEVLLPNKYASCVRQLLQEGITPFPYKVAKALDPSMYRNIEFDSWNEHRKELRLQNWYYGGSDFKIGAKCYVKLRNAELKDPYLCHIQEISCDKSQCVVFVEKLGEKHLVPYSALLPLPPEQFQPWSLPFRLQQKGNCRGNRHNYGFFRHYHNYRYRYRGAQYFVAHDDAAYYLEKSMNYAQRHTYEATTFGGCGGSGGFMNVPMYPNYNYPLPECEPSKLYDAAFADCNIASQGFNPYYPYGTPTPYNKLTELSHFVPPTMEYCTMPVTVEHTLVGKMVAIEQQSNTVPNAAPGNAETAIVSKPNDDGTTQDPAIDIVKGNDDANGGFEFIETLEPISAVALDNGQALVDPNGSYMPPLAPNGYGMTVEYAPNMYPIPQQAMAYQPEDPYQQYGYDNYPGQLHAQPMYNMCMLPGYNAPAAAVPVAPNFYMQPPGAVVNAPMGMSSAVMTQVSMPGGVVAASQQVPQQGGYYSNPYFSAAPPAVYNTYTSGQGQLTYQQPMLCAALATSQDGNSDSNQGNTSLNSRVNFEAKKSYKPNGSDLPNLLTLRYFYNLGIEYYRNLKHKNKTEDYVGSLLDLQFLDVKENVQDNETQTNDDDQKATTSHQQSDANNNSVAFNKEKSENNSDLNTPNLYHGNKTIYQKRSSSYRGGYNNRIDRNQINYNRNYSNNSNTDWNKKQQGGGGGGNYASNSRGGHSSTEWHSMRAYSSSHSKGQRRQNGNNDVGGAAAAIEDHDKKKQNLTSHNRKKTSSVSSSTAATLSMASKESEDLISRNSPAYTAAPVDLNNYEGKIQPISLPLTSPASQSATPIMTPQQLNPQNCGGSLHFGINYPPPAIMTPMGIPPHGAPPQAFLSMPPPNMLPSADMNGGTPTMHANNMSNAVAFAEPFNRHHVSSVSSSENGENHYVGFVTQQQLNAANYSAQRMSHYCVAPVLQHAPPPNGQVCWNLPPPQLTQQPIVGPPHMQPTIWHTPQKAGNTVDHGAGGDNSSNKKANFNSHTNNNEKN